MSYTGTREVPVTILDTESLSAAVDLKGADVLRIAMPAAWDAADLTFQVSDDAGATFRNLYWDWGPELVVDAAAARTIELSPFVGLHNIDQLKIRSGTAGVPVVTTADRIILLAVGAKD